MHRNYWVLLAVSVLIGLSTGIYDFVLPLFLDSSRFSSVQQGVIFGVSAGMAFLTRILIGRWSDRRGRKASYVVSTGLTAATTLTMPFAIAFLPQLMLKCAHETIQSVRNSIHPTLLYESARSKFIDRFGKTEGVEFLSKAFGTIIIGYAFAGGITMAREIKNSAGASGDEALAAAQANFFPALLIAAGLFMVSALILWRMLIETAPAASASKGGSDFSDLFGGRLHPRILLMAAGMFVFSVGISVSHCHVMTLFFLDRFHLSPSGLAWVMALHRITRGVPALFVGQVIRGKIEEHQRAVYLFFIAVQGVTIILTGWCGAMLVSVFFWLLHDFTGAGVWSSIQSRLLQHYARDEARATDVSIAQSIGSIGSVFGPFIGGALYTPASLGAPFYVSGGLIILAAVIMLPLLRDRG
ncbi:MAG TPA: MFS transporter [Candidatus Brocadiia bacterium]|nr:MFS transporter [Candidatus Brocadiia bacterium]